MHSKPSAPTKLLDGGIVGSQFQPFRFPAFGNIMSGCVVQKVLTHTLAHIQPGVELCWRGTRASAGLGPVWHILSVHTMCIFVQAGCPNSGFPVRSLLSMHVLAHTLAHTQIGQKWKLHGSSHFVGAISIWHVLAGGTLILVLRVLGTVHAERRGACRKDSLLPVHVL